MITDLLINNFKSIKSVYLKTKKVNLFIGYPNVGKSNVLEAMSLLSPYRLSKKFMEGYVRYDDLENLFYENDPSEPIAVLSNIGGAFLERSTPYSKEFNYGLWIEQLPISNLLNYENEDDWIHYILKFIKGHIQSLEDNDFQDIYSDSTLINLDGKFIESEVDENEIPYYLTESQKYIKKFDFKINDTFKIRFPSFLLPPFGENLFSILEMNADLYNDINQLLAGNDLELVLRVKEKKLEVQRKKGAKVYAFPYTSIADTIQRLAFYLAAIYSNTNSVLLFEEPEAHSFPPFVQVLASKIAADTSNQYFITTHSPYIFDTLLEQLGKDQIAVHVCSYQDDQTHIRTLTEAELADVQNMREEIFFNLEKYS